MSTNVVIRHNISMANIEVRVQKFGQGFRTEPNEIDTSTVTQPIADLEEIKKTIDEQKSLVSNGIFGRYTTKITFSVSTVCSIAGFALGVISMFTSRLTQEKKDPDLAMTTFDLQLASQTTLGLAAISWFYHKKISDDNERIAQIARNELTSEINLKKVLTAIESIRSECRISGEKRLTSLVRRCIVEFDSLPSKYQFVHRSEFIPQIIQFLPEENPLRVQLIELEKEALHPSHRTSSGRRRSKRRTHSSRHIQGEQGTNEFMKSARKSSNQAYQTKWKQFEMNLDLGELESLTIGKKTLTIDGLSEDSE